MILRHPVVRSAQADKLTSAAFGVRATIIDLGLSRMQCNGAGVVHWAPFEECVFEGEGDYQFDIYRMMRKHNGDNWEKFSPLTNVMVRFVCGRMACGC
jgi:serine/threonine-protein kinase haspin